MVFALQSTRVGATSSAFEQAQHSPNPLLGGLAYAAHDSCVADFPLASYPNFLPLIMGGDQNPAPQPPAVEPDLAKQAGSLVPLGDQLGDVGQYYSQVTPSAISTLNLRNTTPITQTFAMTLYGDTGAVADLLSNCAVAPLSTLSLRMEAGQIQVVGPNHTLPVSTVCGTASQTAEPAGQQITSDLHGIYHAEISTGVENALSITLDTESDKNQPSILYHTASRYQAIPKRVTRSTVHIPAVLATRNKENWWDTELIVQNPTDLVTEIQFRFCDGAGRCFNNNRATLNAHERRLFLASHLLYANVNGFLEERAGWFSATVIANAVDTAANRPPIVVLSNIFKQPVAAGATEPKAEQGSNCLFQAEPVTLTQQLDYTAIVSNDIVLRIYNPGTLSSAVKVSLVDGQGQTLTTLSQTLPPGGSSTWTAPALFGGLAEAHFGETVSLQVQAEQALAAFAWQAGLVLQSQGTNEPETTWYAPLIAAPTIEFRWDNRSAEESTRLGYPSSKFGLAETAPQSHAQRLPWARPLNWYTWSATSYYCNETVTDTDPYSTYMPMWWGLGGVDFGDCSQDRCRRFLNSPSRLYKIRNDIPSNCTGRPLLLANEPDIEGQAYMTYHELGRMIYQLRSWPGELYSPVIASSHYDAPTYGPESTAWCQEALKQGLCPGNAACATCTQDGLVDGAFDPHDVSFKGLEDYFAGPDRWVRGQSWRFEDIIEGMTLHVYAVVEPFANDSYWRAGALRKYRDRADQAGWSIIVSEYSFVCWPDENGKCPDISACTISDHVDDLRQLLQKNLGNYEAAHRFNPKKLFWFQTGCDLTGFNCSSNVCLFQDATTLRSPVGACWYEDAVRGGNSDIECSQTCPQSFLPFISP